MSLSRWRSIRSQGPPVWLFGSAVLAILLAPGLTLAGGLKQGNGIRWERNFEEALRKARAAGKPLLVDFWAEWCGWCHRLDQTTYADPLVVRMSDDFVPVKVNTEAGPKEMAVAAHYEVESLPTIAFVSPSGRQILRLNGFQGPGQFPITMEKALDQGRKVMAFEAALQKNAEDAAALSGLGAHMYEQEYYEESRELLYRAAKLDAAQPAPDRKRTRMLIGIIQTFAKKFGDAETVLKDGLAVRPAGEYDPKLLFVLGRSYLAWGKREQARAAMQEVVEKHPGSPVADKARQALLAMDHK